MNLSKDVNESQELFISNPCKLTYDVLIHSIRVCIQVDGTNGAEIHRKLVLLDNWLSVFHLYVKLNNGIHKSYEEFVQALVAPKEIKDACIEFYNTFDCCEIYKYLANRYKDDK